MEKKVLLVADDDAMNRTVIKRFLNGTYSVLEAEDGMETMEILRSTHVDALLLDIIMPGMTGLQILQLLNVEKKNPYMGILVATSMKEKTEREALALGADDVVSKPYDPIVIQKRLDNILAMKESQQEKDLLKQDNGGALSSIQNERLAAAVSASAEKLHKIAMIIDYSKDNPKLIAEMAEDIHKEADKITAAFSQKNES